MNGEEMKERRLEREAHERLLGHLTQENATDSARVEVTYTEPDDTERCGYFLVEVHARPPDQCADKEEALANHPATIATDLVHEEMERKFPPDQGYGYRSVDDVYAA